MSRRDEMDDDLARLRATRQAAADEALIQRLRAANQQSAKARPAQVQHVRVQPKKVLKGGKPVKQSGGCALIVLAGSGAVGFLTAVARWKGWM